MDNYAQPPDRLLAFHDSKRSLVARFPDSLRSYVYVNPLGTEDELRAAGEVLDDQAFVGFIVNSTRGRYLDDPRADGFFALAAERGVPVLVHPPAEPVGADVVQDFRFVEQVNRIRDVAAGLAMIAFAGWLEKYPGLTIIGATAGGAVAALPEKLDQAAMPRSWGPPADSPVAKAPGKDLRGLYVDTAVPSQALLEMNARVFGAERDVLPDPLPACSVSAGPGGRGRASAADQRGRTGCRTGRQCRPDLRPRTIAERHDAVFLDQPVTNCRSSSHPSRRMLVFDGMPGWLPLTAPPVIAEFSGSCCR